MNKYLRARTGMSRMRGPRPHQRAPRTGSGEGWAMGIGMALQGAGQLTETISAAAQGTDLKKIRAETIAANAAFKQAEANYLYALAEIEKAKASGQAGQNFLAASLEQERIKQEAAKARNMTWIAVAAAAAVVLFFLIKR